MSSTPDEVSRLLARTRANRERIQKHLDGVPDSPNNSSDPMMLPQRSPLRERKQRLAALAAKFHKYDDLEEEAEAKDGGDLNTTKEVDVDEELAAIENRSPAKAAIRNR